MASLDRRTMMASGAWLWAALLAGPAPARAAGEGELVYIGMHGDKIHAARFDPANGDLTMIGPVAGNPRPTWAIRHPALPIVYFNEEAGNDGASQGGIQALKVDRKTGAVTSISEVRAGGGGTTHLWLDGPSMTLLAVNYGGGSLATIPVHPDGTLGEVTSLTQFAGSGPHRRQGSPHPHGVSVDPSRKWVLVTDLGADRIWVLPFDGKARKVGAFDPAAQEHYATAAGAGPRHMAYHPNGRFIYVVEELTAMVDTFGWNSSTGLLTKLQSLSTDDPSYKGDKSAAEVVVSKDGRFVYVTNRGDHMIVVHSVDQDSGVLTQVQRISSGGPWPWHFAIHPGGKWMLVANRDASAINLFSIDRQTGKLTNTGKSLSTPTPVHVHLSGL